MVSVVVNIPQLNQETWDSFRKFGFGVVFDGTADINLAGRMTESSIKPVFLHMLTGYCASASAERKEGKEERGIYYLVLKFTPKELAFHRSCTLTFPTAKNVIEGLRQRNPVVFNQAFKIFDISCDVATGWHPEDWELASSQTAHRFIRHTGFTWRQPLSKQHSSL